MMPHRLAGLEPPQKAPQGADLLNDKCRRHHRRLRTLSLQNASAVIKSMQKSSISLKIAHPKPPGYWARAQFYENVVNVIIENCTPQASKMCSADPFSNGRKSLPGASPGCHRPLQQRKDTWHITLGGRWVLLKAR